MLDIKKEIDIVKVFENILQFFKYLLIGVMSFFLIDSGQVNFSIVYYNYELEQFGLLKFIGIIDGKICKIFYGLLMIRRLIDIIIIEIFVFIFMVYLVNSYCFFQEFIELN